MSNFFSIAIDGPSGAGKSTLARRCAETFTFLYVDTGAIYRTVGLAAIRSETDRKDSDQIRKLLSSLKIELKYNAEGEQRMFLNGNDVSDKIRMPEVSIAASDVSALPVVRQYLMEMQRSLARTNHVIMDGRDIGTVVLPNADLKIFLTASAEERARRRVSQLKEKGISAKYEEVLKDIQYRDYQDMNRDTAPLRQAEDAVLIDTSDLDFDESFQVLCDLIIQTFSLDSADQNGADL